MSVGEWVFLIVLIAPLCLAIWGIVILGLIDLYKDISRR